MKKGNQKKIIYLRYIAPIAASVIMLLVMLIPVYSYVTVEGKAGAVSLSELLRNSWDSVRLYLFGTTGDRDAATLNFSRVLLGMIIAAWTLFALGVISQICAAVTALGQFSGRRGTHGSGRAMFLAVVPNRIVLCLYHALTLPIFFIPMLMPTLYARLLGTTVMLTYEPIDVVLIALLLYVAQVVLVAVSAGYESAQAMNIFARVKPPQIETEDDGDEDEDEYGDEEIGTDIASRERQEQLRRIAELLAKKDKTEKQDNKSNEEDR